MKSTVSLVMSTRNPIDWNESRHIFLAWNVLQKRDSRCSYRYSWRDNSESNVNTYRSFCCTSASIQLIIIIVEYTHERNTRLCRDKPKHGKKQGCRFLLSFYHRQKGVINCCHWINYAVKLNTFSPSLFPFLINVHVIPVRDWFFSLSNHNQKYRKQT